MFSQLTATRREAHAGRARNACQRNERTTRFDAGLPAPTNSSTTSASFLTWGECFSESPGRRRLDLQAAGAYTYGCAAGWSSSVARRAHNPEVVGSNPAPATGRRPLIRDSLIRGLLLCPARPRITRIRTHADSMPATQSPMQRYAESTPSPTSSVPSPIMTTPEAIPSVRAAPGRRATSALAPNATPA